jgi:Protein of unknown function (DUF3800)
MSENLTQIGLFCDEAGKESDRFLAVGGLVITSEAAKHVRNETLRHFGRLSIGSEMKWNKTKQGTKEKYQQMVHFFFQLIDDELIRFHCILVDFDRFDHQARADGSKNESLKRMYYQLILHRLCKKHPDCNLYAFPDKANELTGLERLQKGLNSETRKRYNGTRDCLRAIEFRDSSTEVLLQLNDIVLGGVCYQKNKRFEEPDAGHPKANLAGYILGKAGLPNYELDTPLGAERFSIWNLKSTLLKGED